MTVEPHFSQSYAEARAKFLAAAEAAGLDLQPHAHPLLGRDGEALAMDVALQGPANAPGLLILSSACHGVEGFCGSGVQVALLHDAGFQQAVRQANEQGVALLFIHALNPWGFSFWRRTTQENCDLNRNFLDFHAPLPANPDYADVAHLVVPPQWPPAPAVEQAIADYVAAHGAFAYQAAVSRGQHTHENGLFFSGLAPTWSNQTLRHVLQEQATRCRRLGWIDVHTGLGPSGHGERILATRDEPAALARAKAWWGPAITSTFDGSSTSPQLHGEMWNVAYAECPQAEYTGISLEFGTVPFDEVLNALRADQWLENHPEIGAPQAAAIKRRIRDAFYVDTPSWQQAVVAQTREAALQALRALGEQGAPER
jgi:hypothetical protein